ncbi:helix-turn-helix transcriptional regulator [Streptomyces apocyni]|uniref:helix-turn-helix transcriptional regulator n=1 Tax=Streptomyces apocyni TaxID=2654677 RepID=UPI0012E9B50D|nr:helix-turn-helix transcriptional regulator [Streptomyces apocyni]
MLNAVENRSLSPVFVGRTSELATLNDALARAAAGEPQALLVGGEAGVGKTRLIEEFSAGACREDAVVALGGCVEIGAEGLPFAPFSTALRSLLRQLPDELAAAADGQEEELARLLPEIGEVSRGPYARSGPSDEEGTARLFELTARLLERIAARRTVVLVIEDLHWADASTRHLLSYLFRTLHRGRLVVIATYRADDIHRRHPLRPLLAELDRLRTVRRIELARFTPLEVRRQLAGILAAEPDQSLVDQVFQRSDGNAFFVEELAAAQDEGCTTGLPDTLRDLLLVRVEALPEHTQRIARLVAEGGSTVEYALLAAVAGLTEDTLIEALRSAVGANILLASDDGDGYRFRHSLVREAVSDDLLPGERSRLNRRYAEALEEDPSLVRADQRAPRLASYWYHAHDAAKALPAVLRASVEARRRHAHSEQLRMLERAMELWEDVPQEVRDALRPVDYAEAYPPCGCDPETTPLGYLDLMAEATVAGRLCGERERALKITKQALRLLDDASDPLRSAWFWVQRSWLCSALGRSDGWQEIAAAQELVRGLPPSEVHAEVLSVAAAWGMLHEPGAESLEAAERAVEYARMLGAERIELHARLTYGGILVDAGDIDTGLAEMYDVKKRVVEQGLASQTGRSYINLTSELEGVGRSSEAVEIATEGTERCRAYRGLDAKAWLLANKAESLLSLGRFQESAKAALWARRKSTSRHPRGTASRLLASLALARGDVATAATELEAAREHFGSHDPVPQDVIPLARLEMSIAAAGGRFQDVRDGLAKAAQHGLPAGARRYVWPLLLVAAQAEAAARGLPAAEPGRGEAIARIRAVAKPVATLVPVWKGYERWVRAELLRAEGRDTVADWDETLDTFQPLERPYDLAQVQHRLAEALLSAAPDDAARRRAAGLLGQAREVAERLGARPLAEDITQLSQRARLTLSGPAPSVPAPAQAPDDPAQSLGLTSRERDVLSLVAVGRSNRQIAEELFISPKTASVHVSNILAKLGVSGRGEAAALAHRLRLFPAEPQRAGA